MHGLLYTCRLPAAKRRHRGAPVEAINERFFQSRPSAEIFPRRITSRNTARSGVPIRNNPFYNSANPYDNMHTRSPSDIEMSLLDSNMSQRKSSIIYGGVNEPSFMVSVERINRQTLSRLSNKVHAHDTENGQSELSTELDNNEHVRLVEYPGVAVTRVPKLDGPINEKIIIPEQPAATTPSVQSSKFEQIKVTKISRNQLPSNKNIQTAVVTKIPRDQLPKNQDAQLSMMQDVSTIQLEDSSCKATSPKLAED